MKEVTQEMPVLFESEKRHLGNLVMWPRLRTRENVDGLFFVPLYRAVAEELVAIHAEGLDAGPLEVDPTLRELVARFEAAGRLDQVGGKAQLEGLVSYIPFDPDPVAVDGVWRATVERLRVAAKRRRVMLYARRLLEASADSDTTPEELERLCAGVAEAEPDVFAAPKLDVSKMGAMKVCMDRLSKMIRTRSFVTGLRSGYDALDEMLGGFRPGTFTVVGARPSMGKTALALNLAWRVAERLPEDAGEVVFITAEMGVPQLLERLVGTISEVPIRKSVKRGSTKGEQQALLGAIRRVKAVRLEFVDANGVDVDAVAAHIRRRHKERPMALVVLDYLQLMRCKRMEEQGRYAVVSELSRVLTSLAHELGVSMVVLSQLSRESAKSKSKVPGLTDLRESGQIEQDADAVLLLHRPDYYETKEEPEVRITKEQHDAQLICAKNREGATGVVWLSWEPDIQRFSPRAGVEGD